MKSQVFQWLIEIFGKENVLIDEAVEYSTDKWPKLLFGREREELAKLVKAVVLPENKEQISQLCVLANRENLALIPYGGASGVCGALLPKREAVMIDLRRMNKIIEINEKNLTVTAEAGIYGNVLQAELEKQGYSLGHFPASIDVSTLGGWLATRGSGQMSTKYGDIEDLVLNLEVVLPNGQIFSGPIGPMAFPGPKILPLFIGSEGTLGIITQATLKIRPKPVFRIFRTFSFKDVNSGIEAVREILQQDLKPAVVRLYDGLDALLTGPGSKFTSSKKTEPGIAEKVSFKKKLMRKAELIVFEHPELINKFSEKFIKRSLLVLVFEGQNEDILTLEANLCHKICFNYGAEYKGEKKARIWYQERYKLSYDQLEKYIKRGAFIDTVDIASTWENLPKIYSAVKEALKPFALVFCHWSHFYPQGGCAYFTFIGRGKTSKESYELYQKCWDLALSKTIENGGIFSHHHGVGLAKLPYFLKQGERELTILQAFKKILDPNNILNPGKLGL